MFHYYFNVLCFQFRIISVPYFMDECTMWELNDIVENIPYLDRNIWESQRLNAFITAQVNTKKKLSMKDICEFKWEQTEIEEEHNIEITNDEIERLKKLSMQWED